jgi:hypothetical protein
VAVLKIPDPNKPPFPHYPTHQEDERLRILIITVDALMKKVDELERRIQKLERE